MAGLSRNPRGIDHEVQRREKTATWRFFGALVIPFMLALGRYRWEHAERIPRRGPFIMAANHITDFDPLVTAYTLWHHGRMPHYLAKASLFRVPVIGWAFRTTGQVAVERAARGQQSTIAQGERIITEGLALVIYPEGTLTRDPELWPMRGKSGAVRMALETGVPLIPAAHWGAQNILPRWSKRFSLFPRKTVHVIIGEPLDMSPWVGKKLDATTVAEATLFVMQAITALVEELRGEKAPLDRWDPAAHGQSEFGRIDEKDDAKHQERG